MKTSCIQYTSVPGPSWYEYSLNSAPYFVQDNFQHLLVLSEEVVTQELVLQGLEQPYLV